MAIGSNKVEILITAKDKASKKLQTVGKSAGRLGSAMGGLSKLAGPLAIAATAATAIGVAAIRSGAEFSRSFAQVATLLDNVTKNELKQMHDDLFSLSNEIGVSVKDAVSGLYAAISGGIPQGNWVEFMKTAMQLAKAGAAELTPVVGVLAGIMKNYGLEVSETERVSNLLIKTVKLGVTNMDQLGASLGDLLPTSKAAGLGLEETLGTLAALTQTSGSTNKSVTQLNALIIELMRPTTRLAKAVKDNLGASFADLVAKGRPLMGIMQDLRDALPEEEFKSVFGSAEGLKAALSGTDELYGGVTEAMGQMAEAAGTLAAALAIVEAAPGQVLADAASRFETARILLGEALAEPAAEITEGLTRAAGWDVSWENFGKSAGFAFLEVLNTFSADNPWFGTPEGYKDYQAGRGLGGRPPAPAPGSVFGADLLGPLLKDRARPALKFEGPAGLGDLGVAGAAELFFGGAVKQRQAAGVMEASLRGRGVWIDELGGALKAESERVKEATASMIPFRNDLTALAESSRIANEMFGMTAEKTAALSMIETEAAETLAELTAAMVAGTVSFEDVQEAWATQIKDAAEAIEDIRIDEENKVVAAIDEAARKQAEEAARALAVSKIQISMMGKSLEEIVGSGQLVGMTRAEVNTLFTASQMNTIANQQALTGIKTFRSDESLAYSFGGDPAMLKLQQEIRDKLSAAYLAQGMVRISGGNLGQGGAGVAGFIESGAIARTGVHEVAPGVYYNVTVEGNVYAADDSGRAIVEAVNKYAAGQGKPPPIQV